MIVDKVKEFRANLCELCKKYGLSIEADTFGVQGIVNIKDITDNKVYHFFLITDEGVFNWGIGILLIHSK